jgi:AcrR family transcriptional regulator
MPLDRWQRHICGVFRSPKRARAAIDDFILEGLAHHEQVIEAASVQGPVIDGLTRRAEVREALASGELEIRPWSDSYLQDGRFRAARRLAHVRRLLREVDTARFDGARVIGTMDWAVEGLGGIDELVAYETGLNRILARPRVSVLCVYDARRHAAARLREILAVHDAAVVDGKLYAGVRPQPSARDRILTAASILFAENGVAQTGVDPLIEAAGVAKATFYRHFPSKDDLVAAWLRAPGTRWLDRCRRDAEARATAPDEVLPEIFAALARWLEDEDFAPSPFFNATMTAIDSPEIVSRAIRDYNDEVRAYLVGVIRATGHPKPDRAAHEVHLLISGAISMGVATRSSEHVLAANAAAAKLIEA